MANPEGEVVANGESAVAELYRYYSLDIVMRCARFVSVDFGLRPKFYRNVQPEVARSLSRLQAEWGVVFDMPDDGDRAFLFGALFGQPIVPVADSKAVGLASSTMSYEVSGRSFASAAARVSERVRALVEYKLHANILGLEDAVRSSVVRFQTHIRDLEGGSTNSTAERIKSVFNRSVAVLSDQSVAGVFGVTTPIPSGWPTESSGPEGARLIEEIWGRRAASNRNGQVISQDRFVQLQRIARFGSRAIQLSRELNADRSVAEMESPIAIASDPAVQALAAVWYTWASELDEYRGPSAQTGMT